MTHALRIGDLTHVRARRPEAIAEAAAARTRRPLLGDTGRLLILAADHPADGVVQDVGLGTADRPRGVADPEGGVAARHGHARARGSAGGRLHPDRRHAAAVQLAQQAVVGGAREPVPAPTTPGVLMAETLPRPLGSPPVTPRSPSSR